MKDVYIGKGKYDGKGVYAARDFKKGEVVVLYNLTKLTQAEFDALPKSERQWTHSFWGEIYLFPEPGRYVNHSDDPTTFPDLDKMADVALRPIKKDEPITIYNPIEWQHELDTFLEAYEKAANSRDFNNAEPLIAKDAVFEFTNGTFEGIDAIRKAFEDTWNKIKDEIYTISDIKWTKVGYRDAECTYKFKSDGMINEKRQVYEGVGTNTFKRINGNWRITHEKLSI